MVSHYTSTNGSVRGEPVHVVIASNYFFPEKQVQNLRNYERNRFSTRSAGLLFHMLIFFFVYTNCKFWLNRSPPRFCKTTFSILKRPTQLFVFAPESHISTYFDSLKHQALVFHKKCKFKKNTLISDGISATSNFLKIPLFFRTRRIKIQIQ